MVAMIVRRQLQFVEHPLPQPQSTFENKTTQRYAFSLCCLFFMTDLQNGTLFRGQLSIIKDCASYLLL